MPLFIAQFGEETCAIERYVFWTKKVMKCNFHVTHQLTFVIFRHYQCHNLSLGLATKVRAYKGVGQEGSPGVTSHALGSVGKCERMNLHTPK